MSYGARVRRPSIVQFCGNLRRYLPPQHIEQVLIIAIISLSGIIWKVVCHNVTFKNIPLETNKHQLMFEQIWKLIKYHTSQENEPYKIHDEKN